MYKEEAICLTVATSSHGRPGAILRAQVWNRDGEDHAEVRYEKDGENVTLSGPEALAFLVAIAQDATGLLAEPPRPQPEATPQGHRVAGFARRP